jgi:glycosyltransferase involved in cell wall biosynthesis
VKNNNKVLVITYYWPPSGGSGVQRWLKFVKYLPSFGWEPYVFTPENPSFDIRDESLLKDVPDEAEVIRFPIWEPYNTFVKIASMFGSPRTAKPTELVSAKKKSLFQQVSTWIRGNLFIPDPRRFWIRPSAEFLHGFLQENQIQTIITTGPPHSIHLIGLKLRKKNPGLRWIADFRDPWSEWGLLDSLAVGMLARKYHRRLEASVLAGADEVITITPFYKRRFELLGNRNVHLLTNGFDEDDFKSLSYSRPEQFTMRHIGIVNEKCDPRPFMEAVRLLAAEDQRFAVHARLEFIGEVHPHFRQFVAGDGLLKRLTVFSGNIPHKQLIGQYGSSSLLLLILTGYKDAEGFMPGKLFEYLATGLPVLGVGPVAGDAAALLKETQAGIMVEGHDTEAIRQFLLLHFNAWISGATPVVKSTGAKTYSRRAVTGQLAELLSLR